MLISWEICVLLGRCVCDGPIPLAGGLIGCVCVCVCDQVQK